MPRRLETVMIADDRFERVDETNWPEWAVEAATNHVVVRAYIQEDRDMFGGSLEEALLLAAFRTADRHPVMAAAQISRRATRKLYGETHTEGIGPIMFEYWTLSEAPGRIRFWMFERQSVFIPDWYYNHHVSIVYEDRRGNGRSIHPASLQARDQLLQVNGVLSNLRYGAGDIEGRALQALNTRLNAVLKQGSRSWMSMLGV